MSANFTSSRRVASLSALRSLPRTLLPLALLSLLLSLLLALPSGCAKRDLADLEPKPRKVLLIGVDGFDYEMMKPLFDAGQLKKLAELRTRGILVPLLGEQATLDPHSVGLDPAESFTTIATGLPPTKTGNGDNKADIVRGHGVRDLTVPIVQGYERAPVTSAHRQAPNFWDVLSAVGVKCAVTNWPATWPSEPLDGYLVTDRFFLEKLNLGPFGPAGRVDLPTIDPAFRQHGQHLTWPADLADRHAGELAAALNGKLPPIFDAMKRLQSIATDAPTLRNLKQLEQSLRTDFAAKQSLQTLLKADPSIQFAACSLDSFDVACHLFWMNIQPDGWLRHASPAMRAKVPADFKKFADVIPMAAIALDAMVRDLCDAMGPDTTVLLVTDHALMPELELSNRDFNLNRLFEEVGLLKRLPDGSIDWAQTTCFDRTTWPTHFIRHVSINFAGEWPQGWIPKPTAQERAVRWREIQQKLVSLPIDRNWRDADGGIHNSLFWDVKMGDEDSHFILFSTLPAETQVTFPDGKLLGLSTLFPLRYTYAKHTRAGDKMGMLLLSYPGEQGDAYGKRGVPMGKGGGRSYQIAPLVLGLYGIPLPEARDEATPTADFLYWMLDVREAQEMALMPRVASYEALVRFADPQSPLGAHRARMRDYVQSLRYSFDSAVNVAGIDLAPSGAAAGSAPGDETSGAVSDQADDGR